MAPESDQLRLLLVDDEPKLTDFLKMELEVEGYEVEVAADGASGLIALRGEPGPDLVLLDWNLPDFTGLDICRRIRATGMTVPVLMLTGYDEVKDKVEALDAVLTTTSSNPPLKNSWRACGLATAFTSYTTTSQRAGSIAIGDLSSIMNHDVRRGNRAIQLSNKEYQLGIPDALTNKVQSRRNRMAFGVKVYGDDNLLDVYIRYLRQKVESLTNQN